MEKASFYTNQNSINRRGQGGQRTCEEHDERALEGVVPELGDAAHEACDDAGEEAEDEGKGPVHDAPGGVPPAAHRQVDEQRVACDGDRVIKAGRRHHCRRDGCMPTSWLTHHSSQIAAHRDCQAMSHWSTFQAMRQLVRQRCLPHACLGCPGMQAELDAFAAPYTCGRLLSAAWHAPKCIWTCTQVQHACEEWGAGKPLTFHGSQALSLHLKHCLDDQGGAHSLQDETQRKGKGWGHAKDGHGDGAVKEGLNDARHQQQPHRREANTPKNLHAAKHERK